MSNASSRFFGKSSDAILEKLVSEKNCPVVVSAGKHLKYKHPHKDVVADFLSNDFKIYPTNYVNGIRDFIINFENSISFSLDMISTLMEKFEPEGDQQFNIVGSSLVYNVPPSSEI